MTELVPTLTAARLHLEGAIETLESLRVDLVLRRDEARDESARDAYDEVLTVVEARLLEARRRREALPPARPHHASYVFLLDAESRVHPLPHALFVALARGAARAPEFADRTLRLAEWYVRLAQSGEPTTLVNEQYSYVRFDTEGRIDWPGTPRTDAAALPSAEEWQSMHASLFEAIPPDSR